MLDTRGAIASHAQAVVIGAGLAGLTAARLLAAQGIHVLVLREPVWMPGAPHELAFVHGAGGGFPTYWGRLFFAGEATDRAYEGTVAGALASGVRVAREVRACIF